MSSIPHLYVKTLEKILKDVINDSFNISNFNSYLEMMENLQGSVAACVRKAIIFYFEKLDLDYCMSKERKSKYYYSGTYQRTLVTVFGEIQFQRKYYYPKDGCSDDGFYYVDELLELPKYDCYDMIIKSMLLEEKASNTYSEAARIVSQKISEYSGQTITISRQLVYQIFSNANLDIDYITNDIQYTNDTLYILLDEKYIHTKDYYPNDTLSDQMVKHAILYTGKELEYKGRYRLKNKVIFSSTKSTLSFVEDIQKYVDLHYPNIKNVVVAGDGASWILSFYQDFNLSYNASKFFVLDGFHTGQAICRISRDEKERILLRDLLNNNDKKGFIAICNNLMENYPERIKTITTNAEYIIKRWAYIQNSKNPLFIGCPMESHISHDLAKVFSRDPKAYSIKTIPKHIQLRDLKLNGVSIKEIYLYSKNHIRVEDYSLGTGERIIPVNFQPLVNKNNYHALDIAYGIDELNFI